MIFRTDGIAHRLHPNAGGKEDYVLRRMDNDWLQVPKAEQGEDEDEVVLVPATHRRITLGQAAANFQNILYHKDENSEPKCQQGGMLHLPVHVPDGGDGGAPGLADHTGSPVVQEPAASQPPPPRRPAPPLPPAPMEAPPVPRRPHHDDEAQRELILLRQRVRDLEQMRVPNTEPAPELSLRPPGGAPEPAVDSRPAPGGTQGPAVDSLPAIQPENSATPAPPGGAKGPAVNSQPPIQLGNSATLVPPGDAQGPAVDSQQLAGGQLQQSPDAQWAGQPTWQN